MATLEAFRAVLDDEGTPEIIRNHIIDSLQYTLRNHGQIFTSKEVEWLAVWDDARIPLAASRELKKRTGLAIPVIITDSFGRPWREGLTEFAIGIAGMKALRDDRGRRDSHGYKLKASVEAIADELACAAGLVCGKLNRAPACIVRGFRYEAGAGGVKSLLRSAASDLFR